MNEWRSLNQQFDDLNNHIWLSHEDVTAFSQETCHNSTIYNDFLSSANKSFNIIANWYYSINYCQQLIEKNSDFFKK